MISRLRFEMRLTSIVSISFAICCMLLVEQYCLAQPTGEGGVVVDAGTQVDLQLAETVTPAGKHVGDAVRLVADHDVTVDRVVVIKMGAPAQGVVSSSEKKGIVGKPASIAISATRIQAVDGTWIPLSGTARNLGSDRTVTSIVLAVIICVLCIMYPGGDASLKEGASISATTTARTSVRVPGYRPETVAAPATHLAPEARSEIAVLDLVAREVSSQTARAVSELLSISLVRTEAFKMKERHEIEGALKKMGGIAPDGVWTCDDADCALDIGRALKVDEVIIGSVSRFGRSVTITGRMVSVESGEIIATESVTATDEDSVPRAVEHLAELIAKRVR